VNYIVHSSYVAVAMQRCHVEHKNAIFIVMDQLMTRR
jgi:hypothetical protein